MKTATTYIERHIIKTWICAQEDVWDKVYGDKARGDELLARAKQINTLKDEKKTRCSSNGAE